MPRRWASPILTATPGLDAELLGPGDVVGIDPRVVIRANPAPYERNAPASTLVAVEFSRPDFPWMFSPSHADAQQRLQPWLCLIVVPQRPGISLNARADGGLPVLTIDGDLAVELPDLAEAWAWAHAQVLATDGTSPAAAALAADERSLSRLICPRVLAERTAYHACVVPTFDIGRRAGLDPAGSGGGLGPAWDRRALPPGPFELPVYHAWQFSTGPDGDFHDLVMRLAPRPVPPEVGWHAMTVAFPTASAPAGFQPYAAPLQGALRGPGDPSLAEPTAPAAAVAQEIRRLIGLPRTAGPPRYGLLQAGATAPWLDELNGSPAARVAAAAGTRVVQAQQEALMASAWDQAADLVRANRQRGQLALAWSVGDAIVRQKLTPLPVYRQLQVTAVARASVAGAWSELRSATAVPAAVFTPTFRRIARRTGSLARRRAPVATAGKLPGLLIAGVVPVSGMSVLSASPAARWTAADIQGRSPPCWLRVSDGDDRPPGKVNVAISHHFHGITAVGDVAIDPHDPHPRHPQATDTTIKQGPPLDVPWMYDDGWQFDKGPSAAALKGVAQQFQAAAAALHHYLETSVRPRSLHKILFSPPGVPPVDAGALLGALHPERTLSGAAAAAPPGGTPVVRLPDVAARSPIASVPSLPIGTTRPPGRPAIAPAPLAAAAAPRSTRDPRSPGRLDPVFPQGMFRPLVELHPDLFLVGAAGLPDDSIGRARVNPRFIEAFLVGLNHEMSRELAWRGFPGDGRGSYFRRFWDGRDVAPLALWRAGLGGNVTDDPLVFLIRGELVRRYPRVVAFVQRGRVDAGRFTPSGDRQYPTIRARCGDDLLAVGFAIARSDAASWFLGLEEQLTEPRFAHPAPAAAGHLAVAQLGLAAGAHAADVAARLLRRPMRVMIDPRVLAP